MELIQKIKEYIEKIWNTLTMGIVELLLGIFLFSNPVVIPNIVMILAGIILVAKGGLKIFAYFRQSVEEAEAAKDHKLSVGGILVATGIMCLTHMGWLNATFVLNIMYGVMILLMAFLKVETTVNAIRAKKPWWYCALASFVLSLLITLFFMNSVAGAGVWVLNGVLLILTAIVDVFYFLTDTERMAFPPKFLVMLAEKRKETKSEKEPKKWGKRHIDENPPVNVDEDAVVTESNTTEEVPAEEAEPAGDAASEPEQTTDVTDEIPQMDVADDAPVQDEEPEVPQLDMSDLK